MPQDRQIAVIVGSLRRESFSRKVALNLARLAPAHLKLGIVEIGDLPHYNEDAEKDGPPAEWTRFRSQVAPADGVLFVTPEYNRSIPGALKNAIDVGSRPYGKSVWAKKPAAIVSVTPGALGAFGANHHLRQSAVFLDLPMMPQPEAYLSGVGKWFGEDGRITSEDTNRFLAGFMSAYADWVEKLLRGPGELADDARGTI
ncbi:NADPH-dependent FMN reductase [Sphingosinicella ginsenosidimutans]|uniref:NAD(P)H-dependent oxidoreductase n=1 Tax=Allosphingosinicella ginsenosidimutans TaxID=1176539 RepID=A0A5C6TPN2_9SPHN|nr:NAD(P)H-dependent oxidoreductase [Sphingosinicella ginsenosidimutans]TXC62467.1 NAD(P)H-dependent oxidoreductase [Sphingosinicella ginsenosidimutans]